MAQLNIVHFDHQRDLSRDELEAAKSIYLIVNITINNNNIIIIVFSSSNHYYNYYHCHITIINSNTSMHYRT